MDNTIDNMKILLGGDTKVSGLLTDEELALFIPSSTNVYQSSSRAAFAIAATYAHKASQSIDVLTVQNTQRATEWRNLAVELGRQSMNYIESSGTVEFVYIESITNTGEVTDSVFSKHMFENVGSRRRF